MAKPSIYDNAALSIEGTYVAEATSIGVEYVDGDEAIPLLAGGGQTVMTVAPGGRMMRVTWEMAVPSDNASDLILIRDYYLRSEQVRIGVVLMGSGVAMQARGFIQEPKVSARVQSSIVYALSWIGPQAEFA